MTGAPLPRPTLSVVVCAFSTARLELTVASVASLAAQDPPPEQILLVVDHNEPLRAALEERLGGATIVSSEGPRGLSGARNTGLAHAAGEIVAFVDDDAAAQPGWSSAILAPFVDEEVLAVGGIATPSWAQGAPAWFPEELLWAVGCSYAGQRTDGAVRNPLGCNMAFRTESVRQAGSFDPSLGRLGTLPFGCEETELCLRLTRANPGSRIVIAPGAVVAHHVPAERRSIGYLWRRSYYEGVGKAIMRRASDGEAIGAEKAYALTVLPRAVLRDVGGMIRLRQPAVRARRIAAVTGSLGLAGIGYLQGLITRPKGPVAAAQGTAPAQGAARADPKAARR